MLFSIQPIVPYLLCCSIWQLSSTNKTLIVYAGKKLLIKGAIINVTQVELLLVNSNADTKLMSTSSRLEFPILADDSIDIIVGVDAHLMNIVLYGLSGGDRFHLFTYVR